MFFMDLVNIWVFKVIRPVIDGITPELEIGGSLFKSFCFRFDDSSDHQAFIEVGAFLVVS